MSAINHHPDQATLAAYAAGNLSESMGLAMATHMSMCQKCRSRMESMENIGAAAMDGLAGMSMRDGALDSILASLSVSDMEPIQITPQSRRKTVVPPPLLDYLPADDYESVPWKTMAPGVRTWIVPGLDSGEGNLRLMHIAPGVTIPEHGHQGNELTLVLKGSYSDEVGRFKAGDMADLDADTEHQPIADSDEACICLIVTEGPLRFKSMVPRIVQYFTGF